jgi:hypothetical protein
MVDILFYIASKSPLETKWLIYMYTYDNYVLNVRDVICSLYYYEIITLNDTSFSMFV